jgi:hypothetical protein
LKEKKRNTTINDILVRAYAQKEKYGKLDSELDFQIKEIKQKKLTNYQRYLLSKIEMEASKFDRKRNE